MTTRDQGEWIRLRHATDRLRAHLDGLDTALRLGGPIGTEVAQGIAQTAVEMAMQIAKHDAYAMAASDAADRREEEGMGA